MNSHNLRTTPQFLVPTCCSLHPPHHLHPAHATYIMPTLPSTGQSGAVRRFFENTINTRTTDSSPSSIFARQSDGGGNSGSSCDGTCLGGGEIAGIVLGTIAGTLLLLWIIQSCTGGLVKTPPAAGTGNWQEDIEPKRHHHHDRHRHSRSRHSRRGSSGLTEPQPVIITDRSRSRPRQPTYVYAEAPRGRR